MSVQSSNKNQCWIALKYIEPQQFKTTLTLKDPLGNIVIFMKDKEAIIQKIAFLSPLKIILREPRILVGTAHLTITKKEV